MNKIRATLRREGTPAPIHGLSPIHVRSDWGYWDGLIEGTAHRDLQDGDVLRIAWPDGTETREAVRVDHVGMTYGDMGHTYPGADDYAYVERDIHGHTVRVHLRRVKGLRAERVGYDETVAGKKWIGGREESDETTPPFPEATP